MSNHETGDCISNFQPHDVALNIYKCRTAGCTKEFRSINELLNHGRRYEVSRQQPAEVIINNILPPQSEIASAVSKLLSLLRHQGLNDDFEFQSDADLSDIQEKQDSRASRKRRRVNSSEDQVWQCPTCRSKPKKFKTHYDLVRHYCQHYGFDGPCEACNESIDGGRCFWDHKCGRVLNKKEQRKYVEQRKAFREDVAMAITKAKEPKSTNLDQMNEILGHLEGTEDIQIPPPMDDITDQGTPPDYEPESDERIDHVQDLSIVDSNLQQSISIRQAENPTDTLATPQGLFNQRASQNHGIEIQNAPNINLILQQSVYDRHVQYEPNAQSNTSLGFYDRSSSQHCQVQDGEGTSHVPNPPNVNPMLLSVFDRHTKYPYAHTNPPTNTQWDIASLPPSGSG
ncbi:hypothetical protein BGZ61DRAFT_203704 [Ilyonectria robusta]|uniref:uncharacterized protein n=1 Tax=Ilyonectria robusta TaxID=1079257 RepID=UPI001E8D9807|nr:uncharacterized protein BGZ61DRAFT_203704 [Ilyonectria robusta]KAH8654683.1 hypothetical protein BGZ61DRAFT_203704 [Ilyonectria robusta]